MKHIMLTLALAVSGATVAYAGAYAAQADVPRNNFIQAAMIGQGLGGGSNTAQADVIAPPSTIDPDMAIDPPQTGARMLVVHPPGVPLLHLVPPR
jgi:hypothetical protein